MWDQLWQASANIWWVFLLLFVLALIIVSLLASQNSALASQGQGVVVIIYDPQKCDGGDGEFSSKFFPGALPFSQSLAIQYLEIDGWKKGSADGRFWKKDVQRAVLAKMRHGPHSLTFWPF